MGETMLSRLPQPQALIIKGLNHLLQQEPWAQQKLRHYVGKTIRIINGERQWSVTINVDGSVSSSDEAVAPNVTVTIPEDKTSQLIQLLINKNAMTDVADLIYIQGEAGLARLVSELAADLRWDGEYFLMEHFGPVVATQIIQVKQGLEKNGRNFLLNLMGNISEFLSYEQGITVTPYMVKDMGLDLKDLEQRIEQLENDLSSGGKIN